MTDHYNPKIHYADKLWDIMWSWMEDFRQQPALIESEIRGVVDEIWNRSSEDVDLKTPYDEGYEAGNKDGLETGNYDGHKEGYEEGYEAAKAKYATEEQLI